MAPKKAKLDEMNSLLAAANATLAIKQARSVSWSDVGLGVCLVCVLVLLHAHPPLQG